MFSAAFRFAVLAFAGGAPLWFVGGLSAGGKGLREWTFEEAAKHWRPMVRRVQHVGVPGYPLAALDFEKRFREVHEFWQEILARRSQISTPDPFINDYTAAVAGQMAQQVAYRRQSNVWMYKTSPNHLSHGLELWALTVANDSNTVVANAGLRLAVSPEKIRVRLRSADGRPDLPTNCSRCRSPSRRRRAASRCWRRCGKGERAATSWRASCLRRCCRTCFGRRSG